MSWRRQRHLRRIRLRSQSRILSAPARLIVNWLFLAEARRTPPYSRCSPIRFSHWGYPYASLTNSVCLLRPKRRWPSHSSLTRRGTIDRRMCLRPLEREELRSSGRFPMRSRRVAIACLLITMTWLLSCSRPADPNTFTMIIEGSPTNLDPRVGRDAYSERIYELIFDALLTRGDDLSVKPGLAERWEIPDPLT